MDDAKLDGLREALSAIKVIDKTADRRSRASMSRKSPSAISIDSNVRCKRIYPTEDTRKNVSELKTIGIKLSKDQAIDLARVLLAVTQEWHEIDITGWRYDKRKSDDTYRLTVTSDRPEAE